MLQDTSAGKEELKMRAVALKILGKIFQVILFGQELHHLYSFYGLDIEDLYSESEVCAKCRCIKQDQFSRGR